MDICWLPNQALPTGTQQTHLQPHQPASQQTQQTDDQPTVQSIKVAMEDMKSDIHIMISTMQSSVMSELTRLKDSQQLLEERFTTIEIDLADVAEQHNDEVPTFASTPDRPITNRRKRHTPVEMQVEL